MKGETTYKIIDNIELLSWFGWNVIQVNTGDTFNSLFGFAVDFEYFEMPVNRLN